jgi:putative transposase
MARKRYKAEEIVAKLRQVDVLTSQGQSMADAIRQIGVSEVTYYRWRQEFGGLKIEQIRRLKELELENTRLRKAVSDLTLDKLILQEAARGNFSDPRHSRGWSQIATPNHSDTGQFDDPTHVAGVFRTIYPRPTTGLGRQASQ